MMLEAKKRYVDAGSYERGRSRYKKRLNRWESASAVGLVMVALGGLIIAVLNADASLALPFILGVVGSCIFGLGVLIQWFARFVMRRYHIEDFTYQMALHFMREMGVHDPSTVTAHNPQYLEAYEKVLVVAADLKLKNVGGRHPDRHERFYYFVDPAVHRIASLVLRGERSLSACPTLITLVKEQGIQDYDALIYLLDDKSKLDTFPTE